MFATGRLFIPSAPIEEVRRGAAAYCRRFGIVTPPSENDRLVLAVPRVVKQVARAYAELPDLDPAALPAFRALGEEIKRQFDHLTKSASKGGMRFEVTVCAQDPYSYPREFFADIREGRIAVLSAATTGGHPFFTNDENDMFRAIHDVFGHAGAGRGVDRHSEESTLHKHAAMFTDLAVQALVTETRGQNHAMLAANGVFQPQKVALLPARLRRLDLAYVGSMTERASAYREAITYQEAAFSSD
jgi:hypothetical protein